MRVVGLATLGPLRAVIAQVVEHVLGKNEVNSANLFNGSQGVKKGKNKYAEVVVLVGP